MKRSLGSWGNITYHVPWNHARLSEALWYIQKIKKTKSRHQNVYKVPCANSDKTYVGETGRKLGVRLQEHRTGVQNQASFYQKSALQNFSRIQQIGSHHPCSTRKPCDKLVWYISDRQRTRQSHQMDQGSNSHLQRGTTSHEPRRRQLPTQPHVRPLSWHRTYLLCQEEKMIVFILLTKTSGGSWNVEEQTIFWSYLMNLLL